MTIVTDATPLEEPKNPDTCNIFTLYKLLASPEQIEVMRGNYLGGNYGYGHAKQALFELICEEFKEIREKYNHYINNTEEVERLLKIGADKATIIANATLGRVREKMGY